MQVDRIDAAASGVAKDKRKWPKLGKSYSRAIHAGPKIAMQGGGSCPCMAKDYCAGVELFGR